MWLELVVCGLGQLWMGRLWGWLVEHVGYWDLLVLGVEFLGMCSKERFVLVDVVQADPWVLQASFVQAGELVLVCAGHVAVILMVFVDVYWVLYDYLWGEAPEAVFCCLGGLLLLVDVHSCPLRAVGREIAPPCLPVLSKILHILQCGLVLALDSWVKFLGLLAYYWLRFQKRRRKLSQNDHFHYLKAN